MVPVSVIGLQGTSHEEHGHTHEHMDHPGLFTERDPPLVHRAFSERGFTVGIGGPVGSGYVSRRSLQKSMVLLRTPQY